MRAAPRLLPPSLLVAAGLLAAGMAGATPQSSPAQKKIYCWDEGGRRVCGDALPAEAADRARTEINPKSGLATARIGRALTPEERLAAQQAEEAARRQQEALAQAKRRDLAMVESYQTEADLRRAFGERIALVDEAIKTSRLGVANLRNSLSSLLRQAGDRELGSEPVPKGLADAIQSRHGELLLQQRILADQERERASLDAELNDALARYRAMKAGQPVAPAATANVTP
ncbi:hypothetical protein [Thermomonas flagellata]|uniref:hypothetical protein n=1 Tax=Thermomonas flagellata TaxID=2888524 RepID=UPI001F04B478|nr:hypothetical protein [Thermomonas flagellata]